VPYTLIDEAGAEAIDFGTLGDPATGGSMALSTLRDELRLMLGNRQDVEPGRLDLWLNMAYVDLWTSLPLEKAKANVAFDLVAGQPFYLLSEIVESTEELAVVDDESIDGGWLLHKIDLAAWRRMPEDDDEPSEFFRQGNVLVLYPTPSEARTAVLDFRMVPAELVEDTDAPLLGREWREGLLLSAKAKGLYALEEDSRALVADNNLVGFVRRRKDPSTEEQSGRVITSSVPRNGKMLVRRKSTRFLSED
jgi:hypothetical protein